MGSEVKRKRETARARKGVGERNIDWHTRQRDREADRQSDIERETDIQSQRQREMKGRGLHAFGTLHGRHGRTLF